MLQLKGRLWLLSQALERSGMCQMQAASMVADGDEDQQPRDYLLSPHHLDADMHEAQTAIGQLDAEGSTFQGDCLLLFTFCQD